MLVEPLGVDGHREVAKVFLPSVPPPLQAKLQAALDTPVDAWWQAWLGELRDSEQLSAWNTFRRQQLQERLAAHLRKAGLEPTSIDGVLKLVRERHALVLPRSR